MTPTPTPTPKAPERPGDAAASPGGIGGRGRVSKLPPVESLFVPTREDRASGPAPRVVPAPVPASQPAAAPLADETPAPSSQTASPAVQSSPRRRRSPRVVVAVLVVGSLVAGGFAVRWQRQAELAAVHAAVAAQAQLERAESEWLRGRQRAVVLAAAAQVRARAEREARELVIDSAQLLGSSQGHVDDDATRVALAEAIAELEQLTETGNRAAWAAAADRLAQAGEAVRASAERWAAEEATRAAAAAAAAAAPPASGGGAVSGGGSSGGAAPGRGAAPAPAGQPAPAPAAAAPASAGRVVGIRPGSARTGAAGWVSVTADVTTNGPTPVTVTATVGGHTFVLAGPAVVDGTASFSGEATGIPAGAHAWSISAGGLTASGSKQIGVN